MPNTPLSAVVKLQTLQAFKVIKQAVDNGRKIIPLFGSGISIDAGFPIASHLVDYLVRFKWWLELSENGSTTSYLHSHRWPSRHDLNAWFWAKKAQNKSLENNFTRDLEAYQRLVNHFAMFDELKRDTPTAAYAIKNSLTVLTKIYDMGITNPKLWKSFDEATGKIESYTGYRSLLNCFCDRDPNLIDSFFDHFARNRRPSSTHQFIAFLTEFFGTQLILTTNFDNFVETALREEGQDPTVYEITRDSTIPSAQLLRSQRLSVVKLHGGAYSLRTGFDLDQKLSSGALAEYREYFNPSNNSDAAPLVIALGYSGSDRRVMDILGTHLLNWRHEKESAKEHDNLRILWIERFGSIPDKLEEITRPYVSDVSSDIKIENTPSAVCRYRDGRLFLHDLYQFMARQHPVGRLPYHAIEAVPRNTDSLRVKIEGSKITLSTLSPSETSPQQDARDLFQQDELSRPVTWFLADAGTGSSRFLAKACEAFDRTHTVIWIDASYLTTRSTLFSAIEEALHPYDRHLSRITRPLMFRDVDLISQAIEPDKSQKQAFLEQIDAHEEDLALGWLANALRRGRYILAIDSIGEFGTDHPATKKNDTTYKNELKRRKEQMNKAFSFMERLCAYKTDDLGESKILLTGKPHQKLQIELSKNLPSLKPDSDKKINTGFRTFLSWANARAQPTPSPEHKKMMAKALVLIFASFCRRPRSHSLMATIIARAIKIDPSPPPIKTKKQVSFTQLPLFCDALRSLKLPKCSSIDVANDLLNEISSPASGTFSQTLLHREEGGSYAMHPDLQNKIFKYAQKWLKLEEWEIAQIFSAFADFYHDDLYERSQDGAAFIEYFFHRQMSILWSKEGKERYRYAEWLVSAIEIEKDKLLARGGLPALLNHIRTFINILLGIQKKMVTGPDPVTYDYAYLILRVLAAYADVFVACGHPHEALQYRFLYADALCNIIENYTTKIPDLLNLERYGFPWTHVDFSKMKHIKEIKDRLIDARILLDSRIQQSVTPPAETDPNKISNPKRIRDAVRQLRMLADVTVDLGIAIAEPVLFETYDSLKRNNPKILNWESEEDRSSRLITSRNFFEETRYIAKYLLDSAASHQDAERIARAQIRLVEHELRRAGSQRFLEAEIVEPNTFSANKNQDWSQKWVAYCKEALEDINSGLNTVKRRRHKCYLFLAKARINTFMHQWHEADVNFRRARASLSRAVGAPERAALGVVYMYQAECCILKADFPAELEQENDLKEQEDRRKKGDIKKEEVNEKKQKLYHDAELLLQQAKPALEQDSRIENRWRVFHNYLSGRLILKKYIFNKKCRDDLTILQREEMLFDAMRFSLAALINTGRRSDRRLVNANLLKEIYQQAMQIYQGSDALLKFEKWQGLSWLRLGFATDPLADDVKFLESAKAIRDGLPKQ